MLLYIKYVCLPQQLGKNGKEKYFECIQDQAEKCIIMESFKPFKIETKGYQC